MSSSAHTYRRLRAAGTSGRRRSLGRNFGLLWAGESVSMIGAATTAVLLPLLAVTRFDAGPGWMGLLTAAAWLPWLIVGLPAGAWIDRLDPRQVMLTADLVIAGSLASVLVGGWLGWLSLPQLLVVALIEGAATVFFRVAYVKVVPSLVAPADLERANARLFGTESVAQLGGPGLAGVVTQVISAASGVAASVIGVLASACCLVKIRSASPHPRTDEDDHQTSIRRRIVDGVRFVLGDRHLRVLMIIGGVSNFGLTGYGALLVLFLVDRLKLSSGAFTAVLSLGGAGGVLGAVVAPALARRIGTGVASTGLLVVGGAAALLVGAPVSAGQASWTAVGLAVVGAAVVGGNVIRAAWRQRYVPVALMGRVVTSTQMVNYGTMPLAGLAAGALGETIGVRAAIMILASVHTAACFAVLLTPFGRLRALPTRSGLAIDREPIGEPAAEPLHSTGTDVTTELDRGR